MYALLFVETIRIFCVIKKENVFLLCSTGFTQSQLLQLIISIYGGVPEAFEVYHCRPTSTEEELRMFMNPRRATKRPFQYLILEVNKLPYRLQEVSMWKS